MTKRLLLPVLVLALSACASNKGTVPAYAPESPEEMAEMSGDAQAASDSSGTNQRFPSSVKKKKKHKKAASHH